MSITIKSRNTYTSAEIDNMNEAMSSGLDRLFQEPWVLASAMGRDKSLLKQLKEEAEEIGVDSDILLLLAGERDRLLLETIFGNEGEAYADFQEQENKTPEVILLPNSLDPAVYAPIIKRIDRKKVALIAIETAGEKGKESIEFKTGYHLFKKLARRIIAVCEKDTLLFNDAKESGYPTIIIEEGVPGREGFIGNTAAALFPMVYGGFDAESYLKGFAEMVASPRWDVDLALLAYLLKGDDRKEYDAEESPMAPAGEKTFHSVVERYKPLAGWCEEIVSEETIEGTISKKLPGEGTKNPDILLSTLEGREDVMLPYFDGCDPEGSLFNLMKLEEQRDFFSEENHRAGICVETEKMDMENLGALVAYLQMSLALSWA